MPEPSKVAMPPEIERLVTSPPTAIHVTGSNRDNPGLRQLKRPGTLPSAAWETWNPNCENAFTPSTAPRPPPFTCTGPFAAVAGVTQAATTTRTRSSRLMSPPLFRKRQRVQAPPSPPHLARGDMVSLELRGRRYKGGLGPASAILALMRLPRESRVFAVL